MGIGKWIGGFLGFMVYGPLGALAGYFIGKLFDSVTEPVVFSEQQRDYGRERPYDEGQRNSFLFSMLVLASYVIKADNRIMHSEMEFIRQWLRQNFGMEAQRQGNEILLKLFEEQKQMDATRPGSYRQTIHECCQQIAANTSYSERLQLLNFLMLIAQADGHVAPVETACLKEIAQYLRIALDDVDSMFNLGHNDLESAYKVLGVSPNATDDEVKAAYRKMALKHHPDRVATLGEDVRRSAEKKFQELNEAKERIYKARGMS